MPDSPDTCGWKPNPQRKSFGFKNTRTRVHGASINLWISRQIENHLPQLIFEAQAM